MSSAAIAGPTMSPSVSAGPSPSWVKRSPQSRVPVEFLDHHTGVPAMRDMRRIDPAHTLAAAELDHLAIGKSARRPTGEIVERHHAADLAVGGLGLRRDGQPVIQGAALIGLEMAEGDPAQPLRRDNAGDGAAIKGEHAAQAGMEDQRVIAQHQELVEGEAGGRPDIRHKGGEAKNAVRDFRNPGFYDRLPIG